MIPKLPPNSVEFHIGASFRTYSPQTRPIPGWTKRLREIRLYKIARVSRYIPSYARRRKIRVKAASMGVGQTIRCEKPGDEKNGIYNGENTCPFKLAQSKPGHSASVKNIYEICGTRGSGVRSVRYIPSERNIL